MDGIDLPATLIALVIAVGYILPWLLIPIGVAVVFIFPIVLYCSEAIKQSRSYELSTRSPLYSLSPPVY